jgi:hypothetical protein
MNDAAALVIGVDDIPQKEQLILRSLVRLLDGRLGSRLTFSESLRECNVVFARQETRQDTAQAEPAYPGVVVRLLAEAVDAHADVPEGLSIKAPLRMTNVMDALRACVEAIDTARRSGAASGQRLGLVELLTAHPLSSTRPCEAYLVDGETCMLVDYRNDRLHAALPAKAIVDGEFAMTPLQWSATQEEEARRSLSSYRLRELLWAAAHRLGQQDAPVEVLAGRYRLLRWPDAAALRHPAIPRLAALLTKQPLDVAGACEASGISMSGVHWFLKICLASGIAVPVVHEAAAPTSVTTSTPVPGHLRSVIGRLRERLKLW